MIQAVFIFMVLFSLGAGLIVWTVESRAKAGDRYLRALLGLTIVFASSLALGAALRDQIDCKRPQQPTAQRVLT